jgi:hypothetical protein
MKAQNFFSDLRQPNVAGDIVDALALSSPQCNIQIALQYGETP